MNKGDVWYDFVLYQIQEVKEKRTAKTVHDRMPLVLERDEISAQALLNNPKVLVLDEPTAGLYPGNRQRGGDDW